MFSCELDYGLNQKPGNLMHTYALPFLNKILQVRSDKIIFQLTGTIIGKSYNYQISNLSNFVV